MGHGSDNQPPPDGSGAGGARSVEARKTRRALTKLRRAVAAAEAGTGLSAWEAEFAESVEARLEAYGSAFTDPAKGALDEPLSARQAVKLREIARQGKSRAKAQAKPKRTRRAGGPGARVRDVDADLQDEPAPRAQADTEPTAASRDAARPGGVALRVIVGGRADGASS